MLATNSTPFLFCDVANKWKQLGDLALSRGNVQLAEDCAERGADLGSLLLLHSSTGNAEGLAKRLSRRVYPKRLKASYTKLRSHWNRRPAWSGPSTPAATESPAAPILWTP